MYLAQTLNKSFAIAFKLAAPVVAMSLTIYLGGGVLARLMPAIQVFFIIIPLQILISILVFTVTLTAVMLWFFDYLEETLMGFIA